MFRWCGVRGWVVGGGGGGEILQGKDSIHFQNHGCWWFRDASSQDISCHGIGPILSKYSRLSIRRFATILKQVEYGNNKEVLSIAKKKGVFDI